MHLLGSDPSVPSIPTKLSYTTNSRTALTLSWDASTAEAGLKGYLIYQDGRLLGTSATNFYEVTGLECGNSYLMSVKAYDLSEGWTEDWGNSSADETAARSGMYGLKLGGAGDGGRAQLITLALKVPCPLVGPWIGPITVSM